MTKQPFKPTGSNRSRSLTVEQMQYIVSTFEGERDYRMACIVLLLASPMRISDVLSLKWNDLIDLDGIPRQSLYIREQKTGTARSIPIWVDGSELLYQMLVKLYKSNPQPKKGSDLVFRNEKMKTPITTVGVFKLLQRFVGQMGISQCSSHSCRKIPGAYLNRKGIEIEIIQAVYSHKNTSTTRIYLDLPQKAVRAAQEMILWR